MGNGLGRKAYGVWHKVEKLVVSFSLRVKR
jgi:hypothetical protein